jgi:mannose-1-phosphate guanylyltransferase
MRETGYDRTWAIVLAAGEGRRLAPLTRALYGHDLPKQFAALGDERSLLQVTLDRIAPLAPPTRTVVVVGEPHAAIAREQLRPYPGIDVVVQPRNLDTGPGVLLPLARVRARDAGARVAIFPSDHHVRRPGEFRRAVRRALASVPAGHLALLGAVADRAETEYGWIVPGGALRGARGVRRVARFVEKPDAASAARLLRRGALWNTFVTAGGVEALWRLARRYLPEQTSRFDRYVPAVDRAGEESILRAIYEAMPAANFSSGLLERAEDLAVVPVRRSGWCDWGAPERVVRSLRGSDGLRAIERRVGAGALAAAAG